MNRMTIRATYDGKNHFLYLDSISELSEVWTLALKAQLEKALPNWEIGTVFSEIEIKNPAPSGGPGQVIEEHIA